MNKIQYKKLRQALRINQDSTDFDTMLYWSNGNRELARRLYASAWGEPDHLWIRSMRLANPNTCLEVRYSLGKRRNVLTVQKRA